MHNRRRGLAAAGRKLRSSSGESIAEVLIASLVVALAMIMIVSMIMSATKMVDSSAETYTAFIEEHNKIERALAGFASGEGDAAAEDLGETEIVFREADGADNPIDGIEDAKETAKLYRYNDPNDYYLFLPE